MAQDEEEKLGRKTEKRHDSFLPSLGHMFGEVVDQESRSRLGSVKWEGYQDGMVEDWEAGERERQGAGLTDLYRITEADLSVLDSAIVVRLAQLRKITL